MYIRIILLYTAICHVNAEDANENQMLKNLSRTLFPNLYAERLADAEVSSLYKQAAHVL
jgi:hypothetical protein